MKAITLSTAVPAADSGNDPAVTVTLSPAPAAGKTLRFSLTVVDGQGIASQPAFVDVAVVALPVAVLKGPAAVAAGATIVLDGSSSTPAGQVSTFEWQLVPAPVVVGLGIGGPVTNVVTGGPLNPIT